MFDFCNFDVKKNKAQIFGGSFVLESKLKFRSLLLPYRTGFSLQSCQITLEKQDTAFSFLDLK